MENISNIKQRMLIHISEMGISKRQFYDLTGIANGTLDKPGGISEAVLEKYISTYVNLNPEWILFGTGPMYRSTKKSGDYLGDRPSIDWVEENLAEWKKDPSCHICREKDKLIEQQQITIDVLRESVSIMRDRIADLEKR